MKATQILCDECKRVRGESNYWLKMGVLDVDPQALDRKLQLTLGAVPEKSLPGYEIHDICGQECFHKHIDRLLGLVMTATAPPPLPTEADPIEVKMWRDVAEYTGI
jgi:hypothetical protein